MEFITNTSENLEFQNLICQREIVNNIIILLVQRTNLAKIPEP